MSADTTGHKRAAQAAEGGGYGAVADSFSVRPNKKTKVSRDTKVERARIERMRTRRISRLMSQLRVQVLDDDPNSKTDRIAVLAAAVRLIVALRKKVADARAARMLAPQPIPHHSPDKLYNYMQFNNSEVMAAAAAAAAVRSATTWPVPPMSHPPMMPHPTMAHAYLHPGHMVPSLHPGHGLQPFKP